MRLRFAILTALACAGLYLPGPIAAEEDDVPPPPEGVQVEARGQVHEAFAEATKVRGTAGLVVTAKPPQAIDEMPPEEKPEGDHVVWVPGYWSFDDEARDFVWISGVWRAVPPGRTWVPGAWQQVGGGYQWVSGYWGVQGKTEETEYLPAPPDSLDRGPSAPAPVASSIYVPGCWVYQVNRYLWRPGYWVAYRPGWVWTPACYKWTPAGFVFVAGYWDVPLCDRGLLFAPIRFTRPVYLRRGWVYRPVYVIQPDFLVGSLFVRANTRCYYFGNYFEPRYRRTYISWVDYRVNRLNLDINFSYYRAAYARYPAWERNLRTLYVARYKGDVPRPPVTLVQQTTVIRGFANTRTGNAVVFENGNLTNVQNVTVVQPIRRVRNVQVTGMAQLANIRPAELRSAPISRQLRVETVRKERLVEERRHAERLRIIARERRTTEVNLATKAPVTRITAPVRAKIVVPSTAPPPRVIRTPAPPPPPVRPKYEVRPHPGKP
jgi:hypothetical protein